MEHNGVLQKPPVPARFTVETNRSESPALESYPQSVRDLTRSEATMLTEILHLDNTASLTTECEPQIRRLLQALPKRLRRQGSLSLGWVKPSTAGLCDLHKTLNGEVVIDIFTLIQREVTTHLQQLDAYPQLVQPVEADILASLRALKGMWTKPTVNNSVAPGAWPYQINGCPACILARIASNSEIIRNLRVVLQSRTRTRKSHRAPTLMMFVDECISRFGGDDADELFGTASNLAFQMKAARKACVKAWCHDPSREHSDRSKQKHRRREQRAHHSSRRTRERTYVPPLSDISEGIPVAMHGSDAERKRQSKTPSPKPRRNSHHSGNQRTIIPRSSRQKPRRAARGAISPAYTWEDVEKELSMVGSYQELAQGNPYFRATPVPEAQVAPLRVSREVSRSATANGSTVEVPLKYQYSASDYSSSDYWTDASCEDAALEALAPTASSPAMTTWSLVCDKENGI